MGKHRYGYNLSTDYSHLYDIMQLLDRVVGFVGMPGGGVDSVLISKEDDSVNFESTKVNSLSVCWLSNRKHFIEICHEMNLKYILPKLYHDGE